MSVELSALCVTVNTPLTGPASLPSVVPAMLTVAESLSRMSIESSSLAVSIVICRIAAGDRVQRDHDRFGRLDDRIVDDRHGDRRAGGPGRDRHAAAERREIATRRGGPGHRVADHRVGGTLGGLRDA